MNLAHRLLACAVAVLMGCEEPARLEVQPPPDADLRRDGTVDAARDAAHDTLPDAAHDAEADVDPLPSAPDAEPTPRCTPTVSIDRLQLDEGAPASELTVSCVGPTPPGGWRVSVDAPGLVVSPASATLEGRVTRVAFLVGAPVDADEVSARGVLVVRAVSGDSVQATPVPFIARDAHLTLDLTLTEAGLDAVRNSIDREPRWPAEVRASGAPRPPATVSLRGQGTIFCARKSLTLRFEAPTSLGLSPPSAGFVLLALCEDPTLLRSRVAFDRLQAAGLFPPWFGFAEVKLNGATSGLYLVVERPRDAIERHTPTNERILRRRSPERVVEVDRPDIEDIADLEGFLAPYYALLDLPAALEGDALLAALRARMDFDQYLSMLAFNSALENGDNIDELYFYDAPPPEGARTPDDVPYWRVMAWDQDEVFRPCHVAQPSPEPTLYCAESVLDDLVRTSLPVRVAYLAALRSVLEGPLRPEIVRAVAARGAAEAQVYLERPGLIAAHFGDAPPPELAAEVEAWVTRLEARRATLARLGVP